MRKAVREVIEATKEITKDMESFNGKRPTELTKKELTDYVKLLEKEMREAAKDLQFERAAELRDKIFEYKVRI